MLFKVIFFAYSIITGKFETRSLTTVVQRINKSTGLQITATLMYKITKVNNTFKITLIKKKKYIPVVRKLSISSPCLRRINKKTCKGLTSKLQFSIRAFCFMEMGTGH